jgi:hypothetical protein
MPLTFGAATSNYSNIVTVSFGSSGQAGLFAGWFYPTTLTAGRYLFSMGNNSTTANFGTKVGTTTSTLQMNSATVTPGLWTATADTTLFPSGITINNWWFIAGLCSVVTGPTVAWRMWIGNESTPPTAMTIANNTAPAGALATGTTYIGNNSNVGTASFQGDIGQLSFLYATSGVNSPLPIATAGTISADEALLIEQTYLRPIWLGQHPGHYVRDGVTAAEWVIVENRYGNNYIRQQLSATAATTILRADGTTSGTTTSANEHPRLIDFAANVRNPYVRS